ncbi:MAG TPA: vWA domain-containing protein [Polyangiaceae bacterium]|nr:vWA domain-containing protein [Polyangiaceae bacterium]
MVKTLRAVLTGVAFGGLGVVGCSFDLSGTADGVQDGIDAIEDAGEALENIEVCDGMTFGELMNAQTLSESCKQQLQAYLPEAENNFEARLIVLGQQEHDDGSLSIFVHGVDKDGKALEAEQLAEAELRATVDGDLTVIADAEWSISTSAEIEGDLLSVGFVNDYSGSMSDADLRLTAEIETDLVNVLPDIFESEVTLFSSAVETRLPFTENKSDLLAALEYDASFLRESTALYDGMGTGAQALASRSRPLRLLVVATDGQENASLSFDKPTILEIVEDNQLCVLVLGSLFADPEELRDLAGPCGVFFYTPSYGDLKAAVSGYVESMSQLSEIVVSSEARGEGALDLRVGELEITIEQ